MNLTKRQHNTIVAALRCWQDEMRKLGDHGEPMSLFWDIATDGGLKAMDAADIDNLIDDLDGEPLAADRVRLLSGFYDELPDDTRRETPAGSIGVVVGPEAGGLRVSFHTGASIVLFDGEYAEVN